MFERYTELARRTLFFARYEASELGSLAIGTEHLLLGLVREGKGITSRLFADAGVARHSLRDEIRSRMTFHEKVATSVEIPFTAETKRVLQYAAEEADRRQHSYIGTERLLLGVLREERSTAASILTSHGITLESARTRIVELLGTPEQWSETVPDIDGMLEAIKLLVEQLGRTEADSSAARELVARLHQAVDALRWHLR